MGGGAWPFLVGGVICLVDSVNERDLSLLISAANEYDYGIASGLAYVLPGRMRLFVGPVLIRRLTS